MSQAISETLTGREAFRSRSASIAPIRPGQGTKMVGLALVCTAAALLSLRAGAFPITLADLWAILVERVTGRELAQFDAVKAGVFWGLRLPRILLGTLVGMGLAVAGVAIQGMFRNPLAEPGLIGVSGGAALAASGYIVLRGALPAALVAALGVWGLPLAAFAGAVTTMALVYRLGSCAGRTAVATLLLAGIAINALAGAGTGLLVFIANDDQMRDLMFWTMGSLAGASWSGLAVVALLMLPAVAALLALGRAMNAMLLGEAEAGHLGVRVETVKRAIVGLVGLAVGGAVAFTGVIGFVGLVVPHLARLIFGPDHRRIFPASALIGATLLVAADAIARTAAAPLDLPIGLITSLAGAPFFLALLLRSRRRWLI